MHLSRFSALLVVSVVLINLAAATRTNAATTKITIEPASVTVVSGHAQAFTVKAVDSNGTSTDVTNQTVFSSNDPKGSVSGASYTGGEVGTWTVQASYQSFLAAATVTVTPGAIAEIDINPNSNPEVVFTGTTKKFAAQAYDSHNNPISGVTFSWSVLGTNGTVDNTGVFSATDNGTSKVQAASGQVRGQVSVVVQPAPVTNTNTATTTSNANANRSPVKTTNSSATNNSNQNANSNVNAAVTNQNANDNTNASTNPATTGSTCTTATPWVWSLTLVIFLIAVTVLYGFVPVTKVWPVILALGGAAVLAYVQRTYDCGLHTWWAWVITLGTVGLTALAIRSKPIVNPPKQ